MSGKEIEGEVPKETSRPDAGVERAAAQAYEPRSNPVLPKPAENSSDDSKLKLPSLTLVDSGGAVPKDQANSPAFGSPVTDLRGKACKLQPGADQFAVLPVGKATKGCEYAKDSPSEAPPLNSAALAKQAQEQLVNFEVAFGKFKATGSGVMLGKGENECYVATANHVVNGIGNQKAGRREAIAPNGKNYGVDVLMSDPKSDRALVAIQTGADTNAVCKPANLTDDPESTKGNGAIVGFPQGARSPYTSPAEFNGAAPMSKLLRENGILTPKGSSEDYNRTVLNIKAQTHEGNSGGPVYNNKGEVVGLLSGGVPGNRNISFATPISRNELNEWISKARRK